jgi:hypothetical protein
MGKYVVVETSRYAIEAESVADALFVWRGFSIDGEFADDVEFLGSVAKVEMEEDN